MSFDKVQKRAREIGKDRFVSVTPILGGTGYLALFKGDAGLRCFGQSLVNNGADVFGLTFTSEGDVASQEQATQILMPHLYGKPSDEMKEEITVTVQLVYSCSADETLAAQGANIHNDLARLLDADSTTGVECCSVSIQHLSPEALTYGNAEARQGAFRQSDRIKAALDDLYLDTEEASELLTYALCDLRHFADQHGLAFGMHDKDAQQYYRKERQAEPEVSEQ